MERMACVDIRVLPLQLLLRDHPEWSTQPVVVVDRDAPTGTILWANRHATDLRVLPGMRYAAGLAMTGALRGGVVETSDIQRSIDQILDHLWNFSPRVEPFPQEPGIFWLDASGLRYLYPSLSDWAHDLRDTLRESQFQAVVAVGYSRFGSYAAAKSTKKNIILRSPAQERAHLNKVPIETLGINPALRDTLAKLGIETLGQFMKLPVSSIRKRFGPDAEELHTQAKGAFETLNPRTIHEPIEHTSAFDWPETNSERIFAQVASMMPQILAQLHARYELLEQLTLTLSLDDDTDVIETIAPAEPTRETAIITSLIRLRLDSLTLKSGVNEMLLRAQGIDADSHQLDLFENNIHDADRADRALAALRAEWGNHAVVHATLCEGHLPEARYHWQLFNRVREAIPRDTPTRPVVRRLFTPPLELPGCDRRDPDGWLIAGVSEGPVEEIIGPQVISGGWWVKEVTRAYYYVRTRSGRWLWIYHDDKRRRWYLHGEVQ